MSITTTGCITNTSVDGLLAPSRTASIGGKFGATTFCLFTESSITSDSIDDIVALPAGVVGNAMVSFTSMTAISLVLE